MGGRPPEDWRMPPQQNPQATNVTHLAEMSLAIATQNRQNAEIIERFCANMTNESRQSNRRGSRPEYNNDYVELGYDPNDPYGTMSNNQDPYEGGGNNQSGAPSRPKYNNQYTEPDFSPNNPYGTENITEVPIQDNQALYQSNNQTLYEDGSNSQAPYQGNNQAPYEGESNNRSGRPKYRIGYIEPGFEPGFETYDPPDEGGSNTQAPDQGNNQTLYEGGSNDQAPNESRQNRRENRPKYRIGYIEPGFEPGFETYDPPNEGGSNNQAPNGSQEYRRENRPKYRIGYIEPGFEPGFETYDPPDEGGSNNQAPDQGNNQPLYEGGSNNQAPYQGNNQTPYGDGGNSEARAQAETSNQEKELFPRERERDFQNSQPRNDRSRSPPPQRERSLAGRIRYPPKPKTILHEVVDSPRLGLPFGGKYKMTEEEQEDIQLLGKEVLENNRFADDNQCGNCGHFGHWLGDCAFPDDQGTIMGCPLCNTTLHFWDQCLKKNSLTATQQLQLMLLRRRRKPMIRSSTSLRDLLADAIQEGMESLLDSEGLPWTQSYTMKLIKKRRDQPWLKYGPDETNKFPEDPDTEGNVREVMNSSIAENECHRPRAVIQQKKRRG